MPGALDLTGARKEGSNGFGGENRKGGNMHPWNAALAPHAASLKENSPADAVKE
jgi:hypothetical protein